MSTALLVYENTTERTSDKVQTLIADSWPTLIDENINYGENKLEIWTVCHTQRILLKCEKLKTKQHDHM
jgi:hypothetical protein